MKLILPIVFICFTLCCSVTSRPRKKHHHLIRSFKNLEHHVHHSLKLTKSYRRHLKYKDAAYYKHVEKVRRKVGVLNAYLRKKQSPWERSGQYEGDIIPVMNRNVMPDTFHYWPNNELPYEISSEFSKEERYIILKALAYLSRKTCIKTRPRQKEDEWGLFISNKPGHGCSSVVGFWHMDKQTTYLDPDLGCVQHGVVVHELLHTLGIWHQHAAHNRDKYITIAWDNVQPGQEYNFHISKDNSTSFGYQYDFGSIMHYSPFAFSKNGQKTIIPKVEENGKMGQREKLSTIDIAKIKTMYNCE